MVSWGDDALAASERNDSEHARRCTLRAWVMGTQTSSSVFSPAAPFTFFIAQLPLGRRIRARRRISGLVTAYAERLLRARGIAAARLYCVRKIKFCVKFAPGIRHTIWRSIYAEVKALDRTALDTML